MVHWYETKENLIELAEFLVDSEEFKTTKELLDFFKNPERYTEVWNTYQEEVLGKVPSESKCVYKHIHPLVALIKPSAQCV